MDVATRAARGQGGVAVRQLARLLIVASAWSCASAGTPPGGPEDFEPPKIVRVRPDTNAVNVRAGGVTFEFDEVVSERPQGSPDLAGLFLVSPSSGMPSISWRRKTISVSPRGGLKPGTTYTVQMLTGLTDLEGNVDSAGKVLVFSTGPTIAKGHLRGIVFDWLAEKPGAQAFIEAFPLPTARDSSRYIAIADSLGRYDLANVPPGRYLLRGSIDQNKNRLLDPRELYDTTTITLADSVRHEILAFVHDTLGSGIQTVTVVDSMTLRVTMDRALDTAFVLDTTRFTLKRGDSTSMRIARVLSRRLFDQEREDSLKTKAIQDSIQKAAKGDSARRAADTTKAPTPPTPVVTRRTPPPRRTVDTTARAAAGRDTTTKEPPPKPSVAAPVIDVVIKLGTPMRPATSYRLRAIDMRTLLNRSRSSDRVFTTERERKSADSTKKDSTAKDTTRRGAPAARGGAPARPRPDSGGVVHHAGGGNASPVTRATPWAPLANDRRPPTVVKQ